MLIDAVATHARTGPESRAWHVSTRGSFVGEQAIHATEIVQAKYAEALDQLADDAHTWLFEIIYPTNRIVVDYAGLDDLVLLAIIDKATGNDHTLPDQAQWPGRVVTRHHTLQQWSQVAEADGEHRLGEDAEGYVVRFESGLRVKVKFADYVRLHRIVTGISTVTVWEHLSENRPFGELVDRVPDELFAWLTNYAEELQTSHAKIESDCRQVMTDPRVRPNDRKATALFFVDHPNRAVLFKMLDNKPYDALIWRLLKPTFAKPFKVTEPS